MQWIVVYQRVFKDGDLDNQIDIYRDAENMSCEICMSIDETWKVRMIDEAMAYATKLRVRIPENVDLES